MAEQGNDLSRNPNMCASCSSLADGMEEPGERVELVEGQHLTSAGTATGTGLVGVPASPTDLEEVPSVSSVAVSEKQVCV